jgi:phage tail sheath gpL-like
VTFAITGIPSSYRAPITAAELIFGQGASNAPLGERETIYLTPKLTAGTATVAIPYEIGSEKEAATYFGLGSPGHRMARMHIRANAQGSLWMMGYAPSSSTGLISATANFVITGPATATGQAVFVVCGEELTVGYRSGDSITDIGEALEAKIAAATHLPVSAINTAGTVAVTAKVAGASQNSVHRIRVKSVTASTGVAATASATHLTGGVDGSVTELTGYQAALDAITASRFYYVAQASTVASFVTALKSHIATKNEPNPGLRCVGFAPGSGSLATVISAAITQNSELLRMVWQRGADQSPDEILANTVAIVQKRENTRARFNFDNYSGADWFIKPAPNPDDWLDADDVNDAVTNGITPICSNQNRSYIAMSVNTRSKDATGLLDDFRAAETHRVSIMHKVVDTVTTNHALTFVDFAQMADPLNDDGTVIPDADIPERTLTPFTYEAWFLNQLDPFFERGELQDPDAWAEATDVRIDPENNGRMQVNSAGRTIDLHHQVTFRISETTPN